MSTRFSGFHVLLEHDVSQEHAERIIEAIRLLHGVIGVEAIPSDGFAVELAKMGFQNEVTRKILDVLQGRDKLT